MPYSFDTGEGLVSHCLTAASDPGKAVVADRNSWMTPGFLPMDTEEDRQGNCMPHQRDGQNVAYVDTHVKFEKSPLAGLNEDNIYLIWESEVADPRLMTGTIPAPPAGPMNNRDSVLVNELP
jgi:hypothetical protein